MKVKAWAVVKDSKVFRVGVAEVSDAKMSFAVYPTRKAAAYFWVFGDWEIVPCTITIHTKRVTK